MSLPNFMCIGAAKSGTTSLYDILKKNSNVFIPSFKEPHFFDSPTVYKNGIKWYESTYFKGVRNEMSIGDFTASYLFEKKAAERIYNDLGKNVKFIVILRNPVDRAYSHYLHAKRDLHEKESFSKALMLEKDRLIEARKQSDYLLELRNSYIGQGFYHTMLTQFFAFFPKENFLILHFEEDFIKNRKESMNKIYSFLKINDEGIDFNIKSNPAAQARLTWLKQLMKKTGFWRTIIKKMIPSLKVRQIIKNRVQRANISSFTAKELTAVVKKEIYNTYFADQIVLLEQLLNKKMNWNK